MEKALVCMIVAPLCKSSESLKFLPRNVDSVIYVAVPKLPEHDNKIGAQNKIACYRPDIGITPQGGVTNVITGSSYF